VLTRVLVLVVFLFCILYVSNQALWLQDFNKLTYLLTKLTWRDLEKDAQDHIVWRDIVSGLMFLQDSKPKKK